MAGKSKQGTALVTGASSGIGAELIQVLAKEGFDLVLVARSEDKLREQAKALSEAHGIKATAIGADLGKAGAAEQVVKRLEKEGLQIDVLVNNAGFALYGKFTETKLEEELGMIQLNVVALTHLTKLLLPGMVQRKYGRVMNVASTAAFQPGPLMAVYYATKAYVLSFSEALSNELDGTGVTVTALCPGPTRSGFQARAKMEESKLVKGKEIMDAAQVARAGYEGMTKGRPVVIPGVKNRLLANSVRLLPRKTVTKLVRSAQEKEHA